jgi:hypothetical protein
MEDFNFGNFQDILASRFHKLLRDQNPQLIIAIFTRKGSLLGVTFEIGYVCGHYGLVEAQNRLRFLIESGVDERKVLTSYVRKGLFHFMIHNTYYNNTELLDFVASYAKNRMLDLAASDH